MIVVDYLNFGVLFKLLSLPNGSKLSYLYRPKNIVIEKIIKRILMIKSFQVCYEEMRFNIGGNNLYKKHILLVDSITENYIRSMGINFTKLENYFQLRIAQMVFQEVYRSISIVQYVREKYSHDEKIYLYISQKYLSELVKKESKDLNVVTYKSIGRIDDTDYQPGYSPNRYIGIFALQKYTIFMLANMFWFIPLGWSREIKIPMLFFIHPDEKKRKYYSHNLMLDQFENVGVITNDLFLNYKETRYFINRIPLASMREYFLWVYNGFQQFKFLTKINPAYRKKLMVEWCRLYFFKNMLKQFNCNIVYSCYESTNAMLFHCAAKAMDNCVSMASVYSVGYFPVKYEFTHQSKFTDVFFVWGKYQAKLFKDSGDQSSKYVLTGYIGDVFRDEFKQDGMSIKKKVGNKKIITVYDTTYANDLFVDAGQAQKFIASVLKVAKKLGAIVILKTKKGKGLYSELIKQHGNQIIIIDDMASLTPAMSADVVIGYILSTPVMVSAIWGRNVLLFDPDKIIWEDWYKLGYRGLVVHSIGELKKKISESLNSLDQNNDFSCLDPFAHGCAQKRIYEYIHNITINISKGSQVALELADKKYMEKYGEDKVINANHQVVPAIAD